MFSNLYQRTKDFINFLKTKKRFLAVFCLSFLFFGAFLTIIAQPALAVSSTPQADVISNQPNTSGFAPGVIITAVTNLMLYGAKIVLNVAMFALALIIQVAGYNGYLNSTAVNVGWVMVRDITNMFFVVVLLLVAFGTILGLEQYEWKKMLVKFFFAAVIVNFSRIICGVIIDVGQVVMITFVNGIAATAGGNLINALGLNNIFSESNKVTDTTLYTNSGELFGASLAALVFSVLTLGIMLVFVYMLVARLIVLWILIVLSPFAFVLSVIPQTEKYASQWWSEFGNHVVVGPAVVFFLWLSFAVVGGGNIDTEISRDSQTPDNNKDLTKNSPASISQFMDWNNMANFVIGIGILLVGAKTAQSLGTVGGDSMSKATDFAKKTAMVASGVAAGMWTAQNVVKPTAKWAAMNAPLIGGKKWVRGAKNVANYSKVKWSQLNQLRDKGAKSLEEPTKDIVKAEETKERAMAKLELEKANGLHNNDQYEAEKKKIEGDYQKSMTKATSGFGRGFVGRFVRNRIAGTIESEGRSEKAVKNIEEAAEKEKEIEESEYSLSSKFSGRLKRTNRARAEFAEEKQQEKGKRYLAEDKKAMLVTDRLEMEGVTAKKKAKEDALRDVLHHSGITDHDELEKRLKVELSKDGDWQALNKQQTDIEGRIAFGATQAKAQAAPSVEEFAEEEERAAAAFGATDKGKGFISRQNAAEMGKKAAEAMLHIIKGHQMQHAFEKAAKKMSDIITAGGPSMQKDLAAAAQRDNFIQSMQQATLLKVDEESEHLAQTRAQEKATAGYFEIPTFGRASPSVAMDDMVESSGKRLKSLEAQDGATMAASMVARILRRKSEQGEINDYDQAALFAAVSHITKEAWTDDTIGEISSLFEDLDSGKLDGDEEKKADVQKMKDIFGEGGLGLIRKEVDTFGEDGTVTARGKYKSYSDVHSASALQNLVATGGDISLVNANAKIDKVMSSDTELARLGLNDESSYEAVAQAMGASGELGMAFNDFKTGLEKSQYLLQQASSTFKRAALDAGHIQMGGHQVYDRNMGMYRMNSSVEALKLMVTELGKRKGVESAQIHSFGTINNEKGNLTEINEAYTRALLSGISSAKKANLLSRTIDKLTGYGVGEKNKTIVEGEGDNAVTYGVIGGGENAGDKNDFIRNVVLKGIMAESEGMKTVWAKKMKVDDNDSDEGYVRLAVQMADGTAIKGDYYSDFLRGLDEKLDSLYDITLPEGRAQRDKARTSLAQAIAVSLAKETEHKRRKARTPAGPRAGGAGTPPPAPEDGGPGRRDEDTRRT